MRDAESRSIAGENAARSVQTRMLQALVAFVTIMTGAAVALAQTVTPDDPGIAEPGPTTDGLDSWWWIVVIVVLAVVVIWYAQRRRRHGSTRGPR
ncbi:hypothetical protein [Salinarimonas rosea]|uniref:hypothetical protein n=1 Tax=Salinarimonas rosea TaxID=552063 RepID=UPI00040FC84C|nr:hypothetical protein [Salinarimonas rosea]